MAKFCVNCGKPLGEHAAFCGGCGKAVTGPAPFSAPPGQGSVFKTPPPPHPSDITSGVPPPPGPVPFRMPPRQGSGFGISPPPPVGHAFGGGPSNSTGPAGGLPPSPPLWDFQQKLIPIGESLTSGLGPNPTGVLKVLSRIIRATFLDPRIARQAALDENGTGEAILAIVLTTLPGIVLGWLGASSFGFGILSAMISTVLMSLVSLGIMVGLMSALSLSLLGVRLTPGQLLRAIAYSQGANMLSFVPSIGRILSLWTIVTGVAAVREISGGETQKVAIFMIVGAVAAVLASIFIGPVVYSVLSIF